MKKFLILSILLFVCAEINSQTNVCGVTATLLNMGTSCTPVSGSSSTGTGGGTGCSTGTNDDDVWYRFVATGSNAIVTVVGSANFDGVISCYTSCTATTTVTGGTCTDLTLGGGTETLNLSGLLIGDTYYIQLYDYSFGSGNFTICVSQPPPPPANDDCSGAIALTSGAGCVLTSGTTLNATQSLAGCAGTANDDVWYSFTPSTAGQTITLNPSASFDGVVQVFSGSCGSLTSLNCNDASYGFGTNGSNNISGLTAGQTYYLRVYDYYTTPPSTPTFSICAQSFTPPPPNNQDCLGAIPICQSSYSNAIAYSGTGNIPNEINATTSCLASGEKNDVWYKFQIQTAGDLCFSINPNTNTDDYDWALFDLTNNSCSDIYTNDALEVACNYSSQTTWTGAAAPAYLGGGTAGNTGLFPAPNNSLSQNGSCLAVNAGQSFALNVSQFSISTSGYTLYFPLNGTLGMASIVDNNQPSLSAISPSPACGATSLVFSVSEQVLCSSVNTSDFTLSGPDGTHTIDTISGAACLSGLTSGNTFTINFSPALTVPGTYTLCAVNSGAPINDLCGNTINPTCLNFTLTSPINVSLTANGSGCSGTGAISSSVSGGSPAYTYSWTPSGNGANPTGLSSGAYSVTVTDITGCYATASATIAQGILTSQTFTLCNGQSVTVGTNTYSSPGTYIDTLTAVNSCDSIITTNLSIRPVIMSSRNITLCYGDSIIVGTNTYHSSGTYTDILTSIEGCDSTVTTNLAINSLITNSQNISLCSGDSLIVGTAIHTTTGTYTDTLNTPSGCDSIITTNLTVNPAITSSQTFTICSGDTLQVGTNNYLSSGVYTNVFTATNGCDSTVTTNLTVRPAITSSQTITICDGDTLQIGSNNYVSSGVYTNVFAAANGCDSTVTTNLTVNPAITSSQTITICNGDTLQIGTNTYSLNGIYIDSLIAVNGCDSIITTNLTIKPALASSQSIVLCYGDSITVGTNTYSAPGTYSDILTSVEGCDSTVTTQINVNTLITHNQSVNLCSGESFVVGSNTYNSSGIYTDTLLATNGCDSIIITNLAIDNTIDVSTTSSGITITANGTGVSYQWIDCDNANIPIMGETNQSFTAVTNGNYAVIVTNNNCSDTSACVTINSIGLTGSLNNNSLISIYPNPNTGNFTVKSSTSGEFLIVNELGETIQSFELNSTNKKEIRVGHLNAGVYFIIGKDKLSRTKIIVME